MSYYVDEHIKNTERVFPDQGRYSYLRYDMNENPEGLPEDFLNEVLAELTPEFFSTYPEPDRFLTKYAQFVGVPRDCVTATNGTDQAIRYLLQTFCEKGHEVVTVSPSFEMYWVNCNILGLKHVPVPYEDDFSFDIEKLISAITPQTDIVVLLNPNNPLGNTFTREEVIRVVEVAHENEALVIIDEAYHYFCPSTFLDFTQSFDNVVVLRTFSKLLSIAACRLGVIISNPLIIHYVNNCKLTFDVNAVALLLGERVIDHPEMIDGLISSEREGRTWTIETLKNNGYTVHPCEGNFVPVKSKRPAEQVAKELQQKGMLVKAWSSGPLKGYLRISTGSKRAMEKLLTAFLEIDNNDLAE